VRRVVGSGWWKMVSGPITSAPARSLANVAKTASKSRSAGMDNMEFKSSWFGYCRLAPLFFFEDSQHRAERHDVAMAIE
jgi:hypothetical protein